MYGANVAPSSHSLSQCTSSKSQHPFIDHRFDLIINKTNQKMTGFSDLSNELVLEILKHVAPRDLVSACTITKSIFLLAGPILEEHRRLKQQLSSIQFPSNESHHRRDKVLSELFLMILAKPRLAHYVRRLVVNCDATDELLPNLSLEARYDSNDLRLVEKALDHTETIAANEVDKWLRAVQDRTNLQSLIAMLLIHLPDLDELDLENVGMPIGDILKMTEGIQVAPVWTSFSHLKHVWIGFLRYWEDADVMKSLLNFVLLPSLLSYSIVRLNIDNEQRDLEQHLGSHESNIARLNFIDSRIDERVLTKILRSTRCLKDFCFEAHQFAKQPVNWYWHCIDGLLLYSSSSLENLTLLTCLRTSGTRDTRTLRTFKVLREIHLDLGLFFSESNLESFPEKLPASIQIVRLQLSTYNEKLSETIEFPFERMRRAILRIAEAKNVLLPQLTAIYVETGYDKTSWHYPGIASVFTDVPKACEVQGVSFKLD